MLKGMMDGRNIGKVKTLQDIVRIRHLERLTNQAANFSTVRSSAHVLQNIERVIFIALQYHISCEITL